MDSEHNCMPVDGLADGTSLAAASREERVRTICQIAESVVGLGAEDKPKGRRDAYLDFIAFGEGPAMRKALASMSGCGLVARAILRCYGIDDPELRAPYQTGSALRCLVVVGKRHQVWHGPDTTLLPGDVVIIGVDPPTPQFGGPGHALTVLTMDGDTITCVDGGQSVNRYQAILRKTRTLQRRGSQLWLGSRRVYGVVRAADVEPSNLLHGRSLNQQIEA